MKAFTLYVGANNRTGRLEMARIRSIVAARHEGFTLYPVTGYWHGVAERSAIVLINDDDAKVFETINLLKARLEREAVGYTVQQEMKFA